MSTDVKGESGSTLADLTRDGSYYEYSQAADPIGSGLITAVPCVEFPAALHQSGPTRTIPLDLSGQLGCPSPATSPSLCASFIRIEAGESLEVQPNASSQLYYMIHGRGHTDFEDYDFPWSTGDFLTLPSGGTVTHRADEETVLYWIHDEPMLTYLGAKAASPTFRPTLYRGEEAMAELAKAEADPEARRRSRVSVLLANRACQQTRTITPTLWAMLGILPVDAVQKPHRHQSVAVDLIIRSQPGCYTLVGDRLDDQDRIVDPQRIDWQSASVFVTPPGLWHSHHNESGASAYLLPIQDAGLQTYLRTLDIRFL